MNKIVAYLKDVRSELVTKTSWPTWSELTNSAVIVMVASVIIAGVVFVMDFGFENILEQVYKLLN
ncbi:preprotein translocase subunit SecE [Breznakibacter xylanolyticus]|uniref:Protein translocase subunit SecE n=1 Tax=Breznakibacter xylanolyticus TaxID=990 RepID=A0A2W7NCI8_9BACT|nr:preprotein translocase subunit SecE [Breznakibacter xylanolyticus]MBN2744123.1 preprotein translocase subunit SecE [Marinilabiliaceae bacterium]PZX18145.1 preprotein translocase subunit SecE [Breznakibacter xylanolyticus]